MKVDQLIKVTLAASFWVCSTASAETAYSLTSQAVTFPEQDIIAVEDVSAIRQVGYLLAVGADEAIGKEQINYLQFLVTPKSGHYQHHSKHELMRGAELDIEGIAANHKHIYVLGSHSSKRQRLKQKYNYEKNQKRLKQSSIKDEQDRDWLYRVTLKPDQSIEKERISLRSIIQKNDILAPFSQLPSKENGIDIEGIAAKKDQLFIGFRGPILRNNYVPIMQLTFAQPEKYQLKFVQLGGRGIRDMAAVDDGFLLLAGAMNDADMTYQLYHWDGGDMLPGKNYQQGKIELLTEIPTPKDVKAEGLTLLNDGQYYDFLIAYDGVKDNKDWLKRFSLNKKN